MLRLSLDTDSLVNERVELRQLIRATASESLPSDYVALTATGQPVFAETSAVAMAVAHVTKEPDPPSQRIRHAIDPELERLVLECLKKDRDQRPRTAATLRERLAAIVSSDPWSTEQAGVWWREHLPESATVSRAQALREHESRN